jgi:hypothetical protein
MIRVLGIFACLCLASSVMALAVFCSPQMTANRSSLTPPSPTDGNSQSLNDILRYISRDWDRLTRSVDNRDTFIDTKTSDEPVLYLPSTVLLPPALEEMQKRCSVRIAAYPRAFMFRVESCPFNLKTTGCSTRRIHTLCPADRLMKCTARTVISSFEALAAPRYF